jgi:hypothetical protein
MRMMLPKNMEIVGTLLLPGLLCSRIQLSGISGRFRSYNQTILSEN